MENYLDHQFRLVKSNLINSSRYFLVYFSVCVCVIVLLKKKKKEKETMTSITSLERKQVQGSGRLIKMVVICKASVLAVKTPVQIKRKLITTERYEE